ncbi:MAG: hypothetical protein APG12_01505 [Candidatus Methanofastidiosum methylothiophilum]|uniref:OB-fold nucleic acid binding domain protein n=1 Tax=Candidatus Methanofastidiosum methylothiophilum TaxID=1705564 RepID=A0A150IRY9_9EURY|nr:MAG: hypothetical protein APG10_01257 [Candidatus Methanofastidiosum methylthiophilus]KYC47789.1 MAG: hypothetical protein APG11_00867 [Candidatus Methanofastidiosum methylthiophilus]KYC49417.1 MAG: hypothetical protein APG12_01505 [Candidatus Methanofastidiosum methylthiophilus]
MPDRFTKPPFKKVKIKEIPNEKHVSVVGAIIKKDGNDILLDDGTGQIEVVFGEDINFKEGDIVRVFGIVISGSLKGELIQDMSQLDIKLYRESFDKIRSLYYK